MAHLGAFKNMFEEIEDSGGGGGGGLVQVGPCTLRET